MLFDGQAHSLNCPSFADLKPSQGTGPSALTKPGVYKELTTLRWWEAASTTAI